MKNKTINQLVEKLKEEMCRYWQEHRKTSGFQKKHEQELYNSLCDYTDAEKGRKTE